MNQNHGPPSAYGFPAPLATDPDSDMLGYALDSPVYNSFDDMTMPLVDGIGMQQPQQQAPFAPPPAATAPNMQQSMLEVDGLPRFSSNVAEDSPATAASSNYNSSGGGSSSAQSNLPANSTLTEFTKRRNWPAKVVEELKDFLQILDAHGRIRYVSPSVAAVTGYSSDEMVDTFLRDIIHPDDVGTFTSEMNESIATGNPLRMFYRLKKKDGTYAIFESVGHAHIASAKFAPNPDNQTAFCQAVFVMSRPYPTRNASLLDSFLEHKIENERLRRRIAELRREEEEEEASQKSWLAGEAPSDMTPSEDLQSSVGTAFFHPQSTDSQSMPPPDRPTSLNMTLTRENLEGATAANRPDSIRDKMARFAASASHTDTIEMLTGLRYVEGERSRGITTGNASPTLIKGDAGIAIPIDRDPRTGEKKKKLKVAEEYVCTDCGTLDSPEWRKGPSGPKTLCNACGLRWAKKEKKKNASGVGNHAVAPLVEPQ